MRNRPPTARPSLAADVELLERAGAQSRPARVAIASYEFNGVVRNGGIGTASTSLALALAADGHDVELFFSGWAEDPSDEGFERWREHYARSGVALHWVDYATVAHWDTVLYNTRHSLALYRLLRDRDRERPFDVIHLAESLGHGFYPVLAKRAGVAFGRATVVVGVHSPRRWLAEAHNLPFDHPVELGDELMERRSIELADVVVAPSAHMLDWLEARGVRLPGRSYVQQYVTSFDLPDDLGEAPASAIDEVVFFGRLESRKGLKVFCDALDELAGWQVDGLRQVTFLGKQMPLDDAPSGDYVRRRAERWPWEVALIDDLDREAALDYLRQPGRLALMASLMDNSPNTVYEAIGLGLSFLASRGGGTAELVHPDDYERATYDPHDPAEVEVDPGDPSAMRPRQTGSVLAGRIRRALASPPGPARYAVDPQANRETHLAWHRAAAASDPPPAGSPPPPPEAVDVGDLATAAAEGGLMLLADPEAECSPQLGAVLTTAAEANPAASFFTTLGSFDVNTSDGPIKRVLLPTGGPPASGLLGNCFGAGVVLARVEALERMALRGPGAGGPPATVSDLLARAALAGERTDVVPEVLYNLPAAAVPTGALTTLEDPLEALRPYYAGLPPAARDIASVTARLLREEEAIRAQAERSVAEANERLAALLDSRSLRLTAPLRRAVRRVRRMGGRDR